MINLHKYYPTLAEGAAGAVKAGINQFLDRFQAPVNDALKEKLSDGSRYRRGHQRRIPGDDPAGAARSARARAVFEARGRRDAWKMPAHKDVARTGRPRIDRACLKNSRTGSCRSINPS